MKKISNNFFPTVANDQPVKPFQVIQITAGEVVHYLCAGSYEGNAQQFTT